MRPDTSDGRVSRIEAKVENLEKWVHQAEEKMDELSEFMTRTMAEAKARSRIFDVVIWLLGTVSGAAATTFVEKLIK